MANTNIRYNRIVWDRKTNTPKRVIQVSYNKKIRKPRRIQEDMTAAEWREVSPEEQKRFQRQYYQSKAETSQTHYKEIIKHLALLFAALIGRTDLPHVTKKQDILVDYIIPTREFRKSLVLELNDRDRATMYNWLNYLNVVMKEMLEIIRASYRLES